MTPYKKQNLVYKWVDLSKFSPNLNQNGLKFKKTLEKSGAFARNLTQSWTVWYMNGSLILEKLVFSTGLLSNFAAARPYQNQT